MSRSRSVYPCNPADGSSDSLRSRREVLSKGSLALLAAWTGALQSACTGGTEAPLAGEAVADAADAQLAQLDATALSQLVRSGEASALEIVEDVLRRVERVNPQINAVLTGLFDADQARQAAAEPVPEGPLAGAPMMVKNLIAYSKARIDSGSRLMQALQESGAQPPADSPMMIAAEGSGLIVCGITNSPEFGLIDTTEPVTHGATRNPWNPAYTAGGSSGGSGAAVAAGIVPLAHANDGGGSIRLPACHNGVFGLKPTRARELGSAGNSPLAIANNLCVSRTVRDTAAFLAITEDPNAADMEPVGMVLPGDPGSLRVAVSTATPTGGTAHPEVEEAVRRTADLCAELGHQVEERLPPVPADFTDVFLGLWATGTLGLPEMARQIVGEDVVLEEVLERWTLGLHAIATERGAEAAQQRALESFAAIRRDFTALFEEVDVILTPVIRTPPFPLGEHDPQGDFETVLERVFDKVVYTPVHNALGTPAMSVPLHWTADNLPVGVQFAAPWRQEARLLQLAYQLEEARPWADRRPPISAV